MRRSYPPLFVPLVLSTGLVAAQAQPGDLARATELEGRIDSKGKEVNCRELTLFGREAVDLWRKLPGHNQDLSRTLDLLGQRDLDCEDVEAAERHISEALEIRRTENGADSLPYAESEAHLAIIRYLRNKPDEAETLARDAYAIETRHLNQEDPSLLRTASTLSVILVRSGKVSEGKELALRTLSQRTGNTAVGDLDMATSLNNLAGILLSTHDFAGSATGFRRALVMLERELPSNHPKVAMTLGNLVSALDNLGDCVSAYDLVRREEDITDWSVRINLARASQRERLSYAASLRPDLAMLVSLQDRCRGSVPDMTAFVAERLLNRKSLVLDSIVDENSILATRVDAPSTEKLKEWRLTLGKIATAELAPGPHDIKETDSLRIRLEDLERDLASIAAPLRAERTGVSLADFRRALAPTTAFIDVVDYSPKQLRKDDPKGGWGPEQYAAFISFRDRQTVYVNLGSAREINSRVNELLDVIGKPANSLEGVTADFYKLIISRLMPHLSGIRSIIISPDAGMNFVPFAILKDGRGRYLVEDFEISYLNAGRDMLRARDDFVARAPVVVAGLEYSSKSDHTTRVAPGVAQLDSRDTSDQGRMRRQWTEIPGSLKEGLAVSSVLHVGVLSGANGTKAAVQQIKNPVVLHFATHGFFDRSPMRVSTGNASLTDALLRSGIVLAGANDADEQATPNNAIVTALEAASLDLRGTQMVTLSGCDTGLGITIQGEGVYGLRRAFMAAGARAVMMTFWRTEDQSTTSFMADFYRRLALGASKPAALRATQLAMLSKPKFREPHYWGSFILAGDPSPLSLPLRY